MRDGVSGGDECSCLNGGDTEEWLRLITVGARRDEQLLWLHRSSLSSCK
ncbi:unnamed protein product [Anisakis simplex]|uniref:Uncharacterized protein n=1 Tax=Anisakis simplex TaxID=6269 RepID=A0A3P6R4H4_ANISI|nr:unnamed protein product [Anisakis simplex]